MRVALYARVSTQRQQQSQNIEQHLTKTQSTDFARATALLNTAQFMTQDMNCTGQDGDDNPKTLFALLLQGKLGNAR